MWGVTTCPRIWRATGHTPAGGPPSEMVFESTGRLHAGDADDFRDGSPAQLDLVEAVVAQAAHALAHATSEIASLDSRERAIERRWSVRP